MNVVLSNNRKKGRQDVVACMEKDFWFQKQIQIQLWNKFSAFARILKIILRSRTSSYPFFRGHPITANLGAAGKKDRRDVDFCSADEKTRNGAPADGSRGNSSCGCTRGSAASLVSHKLRELCRARLHLARIIRSIIKLIIYSSND